MELRREDLVNRLMRAKGTAKRLFVGARSAALRVEVGRVTSDLAGIEAVLDDTAPSAAALAAAHRALSLAERMLTILELPDSSSS